MRPVLARSRHKPAPSPSGTASSGKAATRPPPRTIFRKRGMMRCDHGAGSLTTRGL